MSDTQFEQIRGLPRIIEVFNCASYDLTEYLEIDPDTTNNQVEVNRSWNGTTETHVGQNFDMLDVQVVGCDLALKNRLLLTQERSLSRGHQIELMRDGTKLFHATGIEDYDYRGHRFFSGSYSKIPLGGKYKKGAIGVFESNPGVYDKTNYFPNGDWKDGVGTITQSANIDLQVIKYIPPDGPASFWGRVRAKNSTGSGNWYKDFEMPDQLDNLGFITVSILARAERNIESSLTGTLVLKIKCADGTGNTITLGTISPKSTPQWYYFTTVMDSGTIGSVTDTTARLVFEYSANLRNAPISVTNIQVEPRAFATPFKALAESGSTRSADGSRDSNEELYFVNPIAYVLQTNQHQAGSRLKFTVHIWVTIPWTTTNAPSTLMQIMESGERGTINPVGIGFNVDDNGRFYGYVYLDNGSLTRLQVNSGTHTIAKGDEFHLALSYEDFDGTNSGSGSIKLFVGGVQVDSDTHSSYMSNAGAFMLVGIDIAGQYPGNIIFNDLMIEGLAVGDTLLSGDTFEIEDLYDEENPPNLERTVWRCVCSPSQKGRNVKFDSGDNLYNVRMQLIETRMT